MTETPSPYDGQPQDDINTRLDDLADEIDLIRTIQNGVRRETRLNSQSLARVERSILELGNIARLQSIQSERDRQLLRDVVNNLTVSIEEIQTQAASDRQQAAIDRQAWQAETRRIWEYLQGRNGGNNNPN